jgi:uncharacterized protein
MTQPHPASRIRAYTEFIIAVVYLFLARLMAHHAAQGFAQVSSRFSNPDQWTPLIEQSMLAFLLLLGFAAMGFVFDRQHNPVAAQGLPLRSGLASEAGIGVAVGWAAALVCILPLAVLGGIAIRLQFDRFAWGWLFADAAFFAAVALGEEIAFRGYAFQRFAAALGSLPAALAFAVFYAILQTFSPVYTGTSVAVAIVFSLLLSTAYLRTRGLWLSWGFNFAWKASRALLFGLAISGNGSHSPVIQGDPMGPFWLTGGGFGLDGTWLAFFVLLAAIPVVFRLTRDLNFKYNAPVIVPAGIPVDLDAAARRQHEAAIGSAPAAEPALVQIMPVQIVPAQTMPDATPPAEVSATPEAHTEPHS